MATRIPPLEQGSFIRVEHTLPAVTPLSASREHGGPQIALHGARTEPEVPRNGADGPALAVQRPDLLMHQLPARLTLGRALLRES
jgi:hypothetical protein